MAMAILRYAMIRARYCLIIQYARAASMKCHSIKTVIQ